MGWSACAAVGGSYVMRASMRLFVDLLIPRGRYVQHETLVGYDWEASTRALGVHRRATDWEIKSSFRRLCLKFHPDKYSPDLGISPEQGTACSKCTTTHTSFSGTRPTDQDDTIFFLIYYTLVSTVSCTLAIGVNSLKY